MPREYEQRILVFPTSGVNVMSPRFAQLERTCVNAINVRAVDAQESRFRGGIRPGLKKYNATQISGANRIQDINIATTIIDAPPNTTQLRVRDVRAFAVSNGTIKWFTASTINATTVNGSVTLNSTAPFILSTELFGRLYYTDGRNYKIVVAFNNTAIDWSPTAGSLPGDPPNTACRLIEQWRTRIVLSGLRSDPHNWFMSAIGSPLDFDYAPNTITATQAVTGGVGTTGKLGDVINCIIPYDDDVLLFGCDHSLWQLSGDPQDGGRMDLVSDTIGTAFGRPWCKDPEGHLYFMTNNGEVYVVAPGGEKPKSISDASISPLISNINLATHFVRMVYNHPEEGINVFITPFTAGATTHYFYDLRVRGWFPDKFANNNYNPIAVKHHDGDNPNDRILFLGSEDGYIRKFDSTVANDDGTVFQSHVTIGPILHPEGKELILSDIQCQSDVNGSAIKYEILSGDTPELAFQTQAASFTGTDGTFAAGLSFTDYPRLRGYCHYLKIGTNNAASTWGLEYIRTGLQIITDAKGRRRTTA